MGRVSCDRPMPTHVKFGLKEKVSSPMGRVSCDLINIKEIN